MNRLDKELHTRGLAKSRTSAAELVSQKKVAVNGVICTLVSRKVNVEDIIEVVGELPRYVSRGGLKLEYAIEQFEIDLTGKVCLDVGASTGGFTDCMLQKGASRVYAVDVGTAQLASVLSEDERVISIENCDIRTAELPEKVGFAAVDVSFISAKLILPELKRFIFSRANAVGANRNDLAPEQILKATDAYSRANAVGANRNDLAPEQILKATDAYSRANAVILLLKPQFELGKRHKGVVSDPRVQARVVSDMVAFAEEIGFEVGGIVESPILGKSGNREFLIKLGVKPK
ncbi:MAG: TlyA family RNA methyltransferase [Oscillospiraceae bacterium]|nr:TlyA family RNA methyltransferase [Oscillospiraceae bacterium]